MKYIKLVGLLKTQLKCVFNTYCISDHTSARDGAAHYLPQEVVLQHQEQQEEGGQDSWWQAGIPGTN